MSRKNGQMSSRRQKTHVVSKREVLAKKRRIVTEILNDTADASDFNDDLVYDEIIVLPVCFLLF